MAWTALPDLIGASRYRAVSFSIGNYGYIGLGESGNGLLKDLWEFNSNNNSWSQKADFPGVARFGAVGFEINGKGYVGLGVDYVNGYKDFYEFNSSTNTWTRKTDFTAETRMLPVGFGIGTKGYVGLGFTKPGGVIKNDFYIFDPAGSGTWTPITSFPGTPTYASICFVLGDALAYIGTGETGNGRTAQFYEFNPAGNIWTAKDNFGGGTRSFAIAFSTNADKGYVGTGYGDAPAGYKKDLWKFDPTLGSGSQWSITTDLAGDVRYAACAFGINTKGYVGTGFNGSAFKKDFYEFNPSVLDDITNILTTRWDITTSIITIAKDIAWDISNLADTSPYTLNLGWDIGSYVYTSPFSINMGWDLFNWLQTPDTSISMAWNIIEFNNIILSQSIAWDISNLADTSPYTLNLGWDINQWEYIQIDLDCGWNVYELTNIKKDLLCEWNISSFQDTPDFSLDCGWDILNLQDTSYFSLNCGWNINPDYQIDYLFGWDIEENIDTDLFEIDCSWNVDGYPEKTLNCGWDIFDTDSNAYISMSKNMGWDITANTIFNYIDCQWDIENSIKNKIDCEWNIESMGKPKYEFESEERNKVFKKEIIRRKQLISDD